MDQTTASAAVLATPFAASLFPLALRLHPVITRIGQSIVAFRTTAPTPSSCYHFEAQLHAPVRALGRIIVAWT